MTLDLRALFGFQTDIELKDDSEWERGPNIHQDRLNEPVRYAPPRRGWTTDPPRIKGYYLCRAPGAPRDEWSFFDVYRDRRGRWVASWHAVGPLPVPTTGLEWSGPVLEPE